MYNDISTTKNLIQFTRDYIHTIHGVIGSGITSKNDEQQLLVLINEETKDLDYTISKIPKEINGIKVNIKIIQPFKSNPSIKSMNINSCMNIESLDTNITKYRPIKPGIAIASESTNNNSITKIFNTDIGTLGAIGYNSNGKRIIISNDHILSHSEYNTGWLGQNIYQPRLDCLSNNKIGNLKGYSPILRTEYNLLDAAYASIDSTIQIEETDVCGRTIGSSAEPMLNDVVSKCGAQTGYSEGTITALNVTAGNINPDNSITWWYDQILTDLTGDSGDSGSVLSRKSDNATLGLIFGLSTDGIVANKAIEVERALGISFGSTPHPSIINQKYTCGQGGCVSDDSGIYNTIQECVSICSTTEPPKMSYNKCTVMFVVGVAAIGSYYLYRKYKKKV